MIKNKRTSKCPELSDLDEMSKDWVLQKLKQNGKQKLKDNVYRLNLT